MEGREAWVRVTRVWGAGAPHHPLAAPHHLLTAPHRPTRPHLATPFLHLTNPSLHLTTPSLHLTTPSLHHTTPLPAPHLDPEEGLAGEGEVVEAAPLLQQARRLHPQGAQVPRVEVRDLLAHLPGTQGTGEQVTRWPGGRCYQAGVILVACSSPLLSQLKPPRRRVRPGWVMVSCVSVDCGTWNSWNMS